MEKRHSMCLTEKSLIAVSATSLDFDKLNSVDQKPKSQIQIILRLWKIDIWY